MSAPSARRAGRLSSPSRNPDRVQSPRLWTARSIGHAPEQPGAGPVAFARSRLEGFAVHDRDVAAAILDESGLLQGPGDERHGWTARAQHHRDELLRQRELILADTILSEQQPARKALFDRVRDVAGGRLHDEPDE